MNSVPLFCFTALCLCHEMKEGHEISPMSLLIYCEISGSHSGSKIFQVFWDVRPCSWTSMSRRFEGLQCLHRQGQAVSLGERTTIRRNVRNFSPNAFQTSVFISLGLAHTSVTVLGKHTACDPALKLSRLRNIGISVTGTPYIVVKLIANTRAIYVT
jgi:hypothetical protein